MSFFSWLSGKAPHGTSAGDLRAKQSPASHEKSTATLPQRLAPESGSQEHKRKLERYARREQLYVAIREAMTRAGMLSASYKFKVLSLDRRDSEFLVMMDMSNAMGNLSLKTDEIEKLVVHNAKARFDISVAAVYWRLGESTVASKSARYSPEDTVMVKSHLKAVAPPDESIEAHEMAAFQRALLGESASYKPDIVAEPNSKNRKRMDPGSRSTKSGESEVLDSVLPRSLSGTQYGDLN